MYMNHDKEINHPNPTPHQREGLPVDNFRDSAYDAAAQAVLNGAHNEGLGA